jgi:hypothetical protein
MAQDYEGFLIAGSDTVLRVFHQLPLARFPNHQHLDADGEYHRFDLFDLSRQFLLVA